VSSLSWDFPSSATNPSEDEDDLVDAGLDELEDELDGLGRADGDADTQDVGTPTGASEQEQSERDELEALEREQLEQLARLEQLERAGTDDGPGAEQSEREQLEALEREQLRQLELLDRQQNQYARAAALPRPAAARPPAEGPERDVPSWTPPAAPVADEGPRLDAEARAAQFLAATSERQALEDALRVGQAPPATELRDLSEPARAARAIVDQRHRDLIEANALLTEARRVLAPLAYRGLSDRIYRRRKVILAIGEAASLAVAFSAAFDVAPLEALLLSGAIALAFVIAGDLGGILRLTAERSRLSAAVEDGAAHLDPKYLHVLYYERQPWLTIVGGATAALFGVAAVTVGVLRAANRGSLGLAMGLGLLTLSLAIAAGLSSWQHASLGSEIIDHLQREEEAAARRLKRAAAARVLRQPQVLTAVPLETSATAWPATDAPSLPADAPWQPPAAPNMDWQSPTLEMPATRPKRAGRSKRAKPATKEKGPGLVSAAAARGALLVATLPGRFRRSERSERPAKAAKPDKAAKAGRGREASDEPSGPGPGAGGESAPAMSDIHFTPPVHINRKFP
jgi:hypothetical protein